jgi:glycerol-3-phosphate dehydrogenase
VTDSPQFDIIIIGGGVNGTGIARDATGRGYKVMLCEMNDLASGTSSRATKLVHGGLRYLEYYKFKLVREALAEREVLWAAAPHIVWPLRFVLPHVSGMRPAWLLRLGLFVYDHLGGRKLLPGTRTLDLRRDPAGKPLKPKFGRAFEFSDGWVDDARLVALNARDAADRGAVIRTRSQVTQARRQNGHWHVELQERRSGARAPATARLLVNAAGPWVDDVLRTVLGRPKANNVRLVKGSHIVTRRLFEHPQCYFFQNSDGRPIFAIPYHQDFTLIGTTDLDFEGDLSQLAISDAETDYLLEAVSAYFVTPVTRTDIVWAYAGVRPLFDDGASSSKEATRDYVLKLDGAAGEAPLLNIFGGKLTTHRRLSEKAVDMIAGAIGPKGKPWTERGTLPGGDFPASGFHTLVEDLREVYPSLDNALLQRLARAYGTRARVVLGDAKAPEDLGTHFGAGLYCREVDYLIDHEWAITAEDVLWRRSKLGLRVSGEGEERLADYMAERTGGKAR